MSRLKRCRRLRNVLIAVIVILVDAKSLHRSAALRRRDADQPDVRQFEHQELPLFVSWLHPDHGRPARVPVRDVAEGDGPPVQKSCVEDGKEQQTGWTFKANDRALHWLQ